MVDMYIMNIHIKTFASVRDICGFDNITMELPDGASVKDAVSCLSEKNPELGTKIDILLFAINEEYRAVDARLQDNDVLAIFPPVSGG